MSQFPSYKLVESHCPQCDYKLDAATIARGADHIPELGDYSICINCGQVLIYRADLTLRQATAPEISELMECSEAWATIEKAQMFIRQRGKFI